MRDIILTLDRFGDQALLLGRVGENRATRVLIDLKSILSQYPDAIASITVKQPDRAEYPAAVKQEGGILTWEITSADIGDKAGSGQAQITIQDADGTIIKTAIATTRVAESLGSPNTPAPDPVKGWVANAEEILADVKRSGTAAQTIADEVKRKLDAGELKGDPGRDGIDGKPGKDGATGATGATPQIKAEAVNGEPGTQVSVTQSGTPENPVLSFVIPRGKDAPQESVLFTEQSLDDLQKSQARKNIGAADASLQDVLVGSEMGNPIAVDDVFATPLLGLTVYGKSTQDGTPTPDAPVPILSAGDSGNVVVKLTGVNVLEGTKPGVELTPQGATYTIHENGISIIGTSTNLFTILLHDDVNHPLPHGNYYLTTSGLSSSCSLNFYFIGKYSSDVQNQKVTLNRDVEFSIRLQIPKDTTLNTTVQVSLTRNKITAYSPYREQLLTLPTPNGLPGIPVTSGGNYTDQNGQQWICDEVDLERGVRVQKIGKGRVNTNDGRVNEQYRLALDVPGNEGKDGAFPCIISITPYTSWTSCVAGSALYLKNITKSEGSFYTAEELKALAIDVDFVYQLATPIETPLTPAEIAAYKALTAYAPDTVVQASDGAGVKLGYQRDVNITIKKLEDAIASMTAT